MFSCMVDFCFCTYKALASLVVGLWKLYKSMFRIHVHQSLEKLMSVICYTFPCNRGSNLVLQATSLTFLSVHNILIWLYM